MKFCPQLLFNLINIFSVVLYQIKKIMIFMDFVFLKKDILLKLMDIMKTVEGGDLMMKIFIEGWKKLV